MINNKRQHIAAPSMLKVSTPVIGTPAFARAFVNNEMSVYGAGVAYAEYFIGMTPNCKKYSEIATLMAKHLVSFDLLPSTGVRTLLNNPATGEKVRAACRCVGKVETAARRIFAALNVPKEKTFAEISKVSDMSETPTPEKSFQEKREDKKAVPVKATGETVKSEMAAILASIMQANIEGDTNKIEVLVLEAQQLLVKM